MIEFVSKENIEELTGKVRYHAQVSALRTMGIDFHIRPDGRPMVLESDVLINKVASSKKQSVRLNLNAI